MKKFNEFVNEALGMSGMVESRSNYIDDLKNAVKLKDEKMIFKVLSGVLLDFFKDKNNKNVIDIIDTEVLGEYVEIQDVVIALKKGYTKHSFEDVINMIRNIVIYSYRVNNKKVYDIFNPIDKIISPLFK